MIGILGSNGRLGQELVQMGGTPIFGDVVSSADLALEMINCGAIINCAAYTSVDLCEDPLCYNRAIQVNVHAVRSLSAFCDLQHIPLIHLSSDYVFGGRKGPYSERNVTPDEDDIPVNRYGLTKLFGEAATIAFSYTWIVRTTGLYGGISGKPDFLRAVLSALQDGKEFRATNDLEGNQTYIPHLAQALFQMANNLASSALAYPYPRLLHIASRDICSRYDFARRIAETWGYDTDQVIPVSNAAVPGWVAKRPQHGGLLTKTASDLGIPIYSIAEGLQHAHEHRDRYSAI